MKKVFLLLTVCFVFCGLLISCTKDEKKKKKPVNASSVTILSNGVEVGEAGLTFYTNQGCNLEALLKDASGNVINDYSVNWTCTSGLGYFTPNPSKNTSFNVTNTGSLQSAYIKADCLENGKTETVSKTIKVNLFKFHMLSEVLGYDSIPNTVNQQVKVSDILTELDISNVSIKWRASSDAFGVNAIGHFEPEYTAIGEYTTFYQPDGYIGPVYYTASVQGRGSVSAFFATFYDPDSII